MKQILIVEDNELNRDVLSRRLVRAGFTVAVAVDGLAGLTMAEALRPDLILLDLGLPEIDGWECARRLKSNPDTRSIPIIALSAHVMLGEGQRARDAGCDEFDTKPINFASLLEKIKGLLDRQLQEHHDG